MATIKLLLVDDHKIVREGLRQLLESNPQYAVAGEAASVAEAVPAAADLNPDVILMDLKLGEESGLDACRRIVSDNPSARILVLTAFSEFPWIEAAAAAGVLGYAPKNISFNELCQAIATVQAGGRYIHPSLAVNLFEGVGALANAQQNGQPPLTAEEAQLLKLAAEGHSMIKLAELMFMSSRTARRKFRNLTQKLGVADRVQAVALAVREGWLEA